jgi:monoamine oxidase
MARTALFARIERAMKLALASRRLNLSPSEVTQRRTEALSRRALLKGAGTLVAGIATSQALSGCAVPAGDADDEPSSGVQSLGNSARVVVVGAGLAGLTCAYRLAERGINARLFDANDRVGGRCFTYRSSSFVSKVELGGEFIDSGHTQIQGLALELGLNLVDLAEASVGLEAERYYIGDRRYTEEEIIELFLPVAEILDADFAAIDELYATYDEFTPAARRLDRTSIREWFDQNDIQGPIRTLLDVAYTAEYGLETDQQSYLNLLYLIGTEAPPFQIFGESDERYTIREGNDALATRMVDALPGGVELGHRLESVRSRADGALRVSLRTGNRTVEVIADKLVLAIPFNQLRKADLRIPLSPAKQRSLRNLRYGTNSKLMAATSSRPWIADGSTGTSFNDRVYHESWDSSRGFPGTAGVITEYSGGEFGLAMGAGTAEQQARRFLTRLNDVYPGVRQAFTGTAVRFHWPTARFFEGSYACYAPGNYTSFVGSESEIEGDVHFCGEHTSSEAQGYLEGAVESGERAAREVRRAVRRAA